MLPLTLFHLLTFLSPRNKRIWVFGSWNGKVFADNTKYLYLNTVYKYPSIQPVWISYNKALVKKLQTLGLTAYYAWSFKAIYYCLRAGYYFIDHGYGYGGIFSPINIWLSGNAKIIQLWHGLGIKKIGSHDTKSQSRFEYQLHETFENPLNYLINMYITSPRSFAGILSTAFNVPEKRTIISGLPRNDVFIKHQQPLEKSAALKEVIQLKSVGKLIFYLPTHRDHGGNPFDGQAIDLLQFEKFLETNNTFLIVKLHPHDSTGFRIKNSKRILVLPQEFDVYEVLPLVDILITDYSGVFLDFLLADKPIVFFPYDLQKFLSDNRSLYFDYETFVPGPIIRSFSDLLDCIQLLLNSKHSDDFQEKRKELKRKIFNDFNSSSSDTIAAWIISREHL